jgi:hypothetical protein
LNVTDVDATSAPVSLRTTTLNVVAVMFALSTLTNHAFTVDADVVTIHGRHTGSVRRHRRHATLRRGPGGPQAFDLGDPRGEGDDLLGERPHR